VDIEEAGSQKEEIEKVKMRIEKFKMSLRILDNQLYNFGGRYIVT
jgi:hypothetical protein